ncbi:MAG TPA: alpha/beta fold hydrolase [Jatrophihabitans sp.]
MFERRSVTVDGNRISYVECGPVDGPVVLLVHGLMSDSGTWTDDLDPLAVHGIRAIAIDLLGHGQSDKPVGRYTLDDFALLLEGFMAGLGIDSATVCGHSLGGAIAVHFGYHYPHRVDGLILVSAGGLGREVSPALRLFALPGVPALTAAVFERKLVRSVLRSPATHRLARVTPERLINLRRIGRTLIYRDARAAFFRSLRSVIGPRGQLGSFIEMEYLAVQLPTLLVWAERDPIIPVAHAHRCHVHLPGSDLVVFPGGGHEPHRRNALEFADAVFNFLTMRDTVPSS